MGIITRPDPGQIQDPGALNRSPTAVQGPKGLGHFLLVSSAHQERAGCEAEHPRLQLELLWDSSAAGSSFMRYVTAPTPVKVVRQ